MTSMRTLACVAAVAAAFAGAVHAQALADGEVRKIDKAHGKITLKHGEIKSIGMPPMAMEFEAKNRTMLDKLKEGDKVRFNASYEGGKYYVTEIHPAK